MPPLVVIIKVSHNFVSVWTNLLTSHLISDQCTFVRIRRQLFRQFTS